MVKPRIRLFSQLLLVVARALFYRRVVTLGASSTTSRFPLPRHLSASSGRLCGLGGCGIRGARCRRIALTRCCCCTLAWRKRILLLASPPRVLLTDANRRAHKPASLCRPRRRHASRVLAARRLDAARRYSTFITTHAHPPSHAPCPDLVSAPPPRKRARHTALFQHAPREGCPYRDV
ncbi:hypothetical protein C8R47DRAFT_1160789 [Mycena vitilis]|nr:hypothetical protein C8R47DRAFT_1160789 [Mycena vitilis]